jgi:glycosyltransferase involved in cell wall biosynthesis
MNTLPVISIVIGSYNRRELWPAVLACIRNNGITVPYEIIVVDGGSTDGTVEYLLTQRDVITIVQHNRGSFLGKILERKSYGYFMNIGFRAAHGKYLFLLSDDALLVPGAVMNAYHQFETRLAAGERVGAVAFHFRNYPDDPEYFVTHTFGDRLYMNHGLFLAEPFLAMGALDEQHYFFYHADADASLRLQEAGHAVIPADNSYIEHFKYSSESNRAANAQKHDAGWQYFKKRWGHLETDPSRLVEHRSNRRHTKAYYDATDTARYFRRTPSYFRFLISRALYRLRKRLRGDDTPPQTP